MKTRQTTMTTFYVGDWACYPTGDKKAGKVIAVIISMSKRRPDRIRVLPPNGQPYEELARKMVHCPPQEGV